MDGSNFQAFIQRFAHLPKLEVLAFLAKAKSVKFKKKEVVLAAGQVCDFVIFVRKGIFRTYLLANGKEYTQNFFAAEQYSFATSYCSLVTRTPSEYFVEAVEDCEGYAWTGAQINAQLQLNIHWALLNKHLADHFLLLEEQRQVSFLKDDAETRYLHFLDRFGAAALRIPQIYVASYLGITPESLSRVRKNILEKEKNTAVAKKMSKD
ncbi:MAG: Crp/Fnr family transcriptional regulator [Bacteroidia bacterium]